MSRSLVTRPRKRVEYVPDRGDVIWLTFDPQAGHEQAGKCPAVVLSPRTYNGRSGLALLCPVTSQVKRYPFEVELPYDLPISGAVLSDQARSLDWRARRASRICALPPEIIDAVLGKTAALACTGQLDSLGFPAHRRSIVISRLSKCTRWSATQSQGSNDSRIQRIDSYKRAPGETLLSIESSCRKTKKENGGMRGLLWTPVRPTRRIRRIFFRPSFIDAGEAPNSFSGR